MELAGRHVVITGAASGIGRACAERFAAEGAHLVLSDRDAAGVAAVAAALGATAIPADVGDPASLRGMIDQAQALAPIDLFFSNAGVAGPDGGPEADDAELELTWRINVMAHVWAARALLPGWLQRGEGYLVSTASAAGLLTQISALGYSMTKHAAVAVAEWLAINYGDAGIRVSCLCPQGVRTPMLDLALADPVGAAPLLAEGLLEPSEVAEAVVAGIRAEQLLILPHPQVAEHLARKGSDPERWVRGMRRIVRQARSGQSPV
jgi:NAD(P)-dependent dehydrogenase (short-subunit alcohol dehydrogenase family)